MSEQMTERDELRSLQDDVGLLIKRLSPITRIKPSSAQTLKQVDDWINNLIPDDQILKILSDVRQRAIELRNHIRHMREEDFKHVEAEFIGSLRQAGTPFRELSDGWRVEKFEIHVDRAHSRIKIAYNHEEIIAWQIVSSIIDLEATLKKANALLNKLISPEEDFAKAIWSAYAQLSSKSSTGRVRLRDLYPQTRVELVRQELATGKSDKRLKAAEYPKWAFLYNLDLYRMSSRNKPGSPMLILETGSQSDHAHGLTMVLGGLDPHEEYKTYCYVFSSQGAR